MTIYLITCMISMLFTWFLSKFNYNKNKVQFAISILIAAAPCILIAGFRYGIGSDYFTYESYFLTGMSTNDLLYYSVFNPLIQFFGGDFSVSVFIVSAIIFLLTYTRIFADSPYPWLSVYLLFGMTFFFASMNAMRQFLALSILLFALKSLDQNKNLRFFILVAIASGVHLSSIIFCALFFLHKIKLDTRLFVILTPAIFGGIYLLRNNLITFAMALNSYSNYIDDNVTNGMSFAIQCLWQFVLILMGGFVYKEDNLTENQSLYRIYLETQLIALWENALGSVINPNEIMRIIWVYSYASIIFTPMVIHRIPWKLARITATFILILGFGVFMYYAIAVNNSHEVLPYCSIFDVN